MKKPVLKKQLAAILLSFSAVFAQSTLVAAPEIDACSKELLLAYFPETFVAATLKKFNVPQEKQEAVIKALAAKDKEVVKTVEDKASKLTPNPLKDRDPQQRQVAVKIFRETLLQIFGGVLKDNGVTDDKQIQAMLDDIQRQKANSFEECMKKQKSQVPAQSDEDDSDSDDNDDNSAPNDQTPPEKDNSATDKDTDNNSKDALSQADEEHDFEDEDEDSDNLDDDEDNAAVKSEKFTRVPNMSSGRGTDARTDTGVGTSVSKDPTKNH